MHIVLAGASGLIGTALTKVLVARGDTVVHLVRSPRPSSSVRTLQWQPDQPHGARALRELATPIDAVVHLAGAGIADKRWSTARRRELVDSRVRSTEVLVDAITELLVPPARFISASAIGIYGDRGDELLTEDSTPGSGFLAELCIKWEAAATGAPAPTTLLRTGIVLSTEGGALKKQLPLFRAGLGGKLGSGNQYMSWISLVDEIAILCRLIDPAEPAIVGPVNATAPEPVTNHAFTLALAHAVHRPSFASVPRFALGLGLGKDLATEVLLASQRVLPQTMSRASFTFAHPDLATALDEIVASRQS